ncbi:MAG TPA: DUF502 domain-containing protein, partial [Firmicutes bacterium]|nr:DUF502 domain-containing protein [Bacillota bacterium]
LRRYFINGLLILLPGVITVYVLVFSLVTIDGILGRVIAKLVGFHIPGAGAVLTILLILAAGIFTTNVIGRKFFQWAEQIFLKIPILNSIYQGVGQVVKAFSASTETQRFQRVVLVEYPRLGVYSLGFVTNERVPEFSLAIGNDSVTVFIPTTPNPTSGVFTVVADEDCIPLNISVEEAFKTIISAGIIGPTGKTP